MKKFAFLFFAFLAFGTLKSQIKKAVLTGEVTYVTSLSAYLKFNDNTNISVGDTIYSKINNREVAVLIVSAKSSTSCVAQIIKGATVVMGQIVIAHPAETQEITDPEAEKIVPALTVVAPTEAPKEKAYPERNNVTGRVQVSNFSNFAISSNTKNSRQTASLQLKVKEAGVPGLSAEFYANYWLVNPSPPSEIQTSSSMLRIFNLALHYQFKSGGGITVGRKYSNNLASVGSIDGVQVEKTFKNFYVGAIAGFRPDLIKFSFNSDLFQYGAYAGFKNEKSTYASTTTFGFIQQFYTGITDRQYAALQHDGYVGKFNFFLSSELDLYNPLSNTLRLTSFYLSARYRITKNANFMLSYDTRKSIVYYESDYATINQYPFDDIGHQGLRGRLNFSISRKLNGGIAANYRFQSNNLNRYSGYSAFVTYTKNPTKSRINIAINYNTSKSTHMLVPSINYSTGVFKSKLRFNAFYRFQNFSYINWDIKDVNNHIFGLGLSAEVFKNFNLNFFSEYSITSTGDYARINLALSYRF